jgi:hypothetical protein
MDDGTTTEDFDRILVEQKLYYSKLYSSKEQIHDDGLSDKFSTKFNIDNLKAMSNEERIICEGLLSEK